MRCLSWLVLALLSLLASAPAAAQTRDEKACLHARPDRNTVAACNRFTKDINRAIGLVASGRYKAKDKNRELYLLYNLRGGAYQAVARRHAVNEESRRATELHLRAIEDFNKAISLDAAPPHALINRGSSWAELKLPDRAIGDFEQALRTNPNNALALNNRGAAYGDKGDFNRAVADLTRAIALKSKFADAFINRAAIYLQNAELDRAIDDFSAAIRYGPRDIYAYVGRGRAWRDKGNYDRAEEDFEAALALPANAKRNQNVQDAVRELLRALQERAERERIERQRQRQAAREEAERRRLEKAEREAGEREKAAREKAENAARKRAEQAARERAELEQAARERAERQAAAREKAEREKAGRERAELEKAARKKAERERAERERAEREKTARERVEQAARARAEKAARENAEREAARRQEEERRKAERERTRAGRIALVVGNSAYRKLRVLRNPRNDAEDIAKALQVLGFTVFRGIDLAHAQTADMLARFTPAAREAETAVFFFAGHGLQHDEVNYLAPIDADERDLGKFISLQSVMADLKGKRGVRILIIDACRTRPDARVVASLQQPTRFVFVERGFAAIDRRDVPGGTFVAYAALPGQVAEDGVRHNSPFTSALLKHLLTPGLELRRLFTRVRAEVVADTKGRQTPVAVDSILDEQFVLRAAK